MFNKSPENLFNAVFNFPQGAVMTISISLIQGVTSPTAWLITLMGAYCAGVMLTLFLRVPVIGEWVAKKLHANGTLSHYLISNLVTGAIMGVLMNFCMTWIAIGPTAAFPAAYLSTVIYAVPVSAVSACIWTGLTMRLVQKVYGTQP